MINCISNKNYSLLFLYKLLFWKVSKKNDKTNYILKRHIFLVLFLFLLNNLSAQTSYSGYIDKYPIELVTDSYSDGVVRAFYVYTKYDNPIKSDGYFKNNKLTLEEKDNSGKTKATLIFKNCKAESANLEGTWKDTKTNKELRITLTKTTDINYGDSIEWPDKELLQCATMKDKYFKIIISKVKEDFFGKITGVKIFEKKTDRLLQELKMECQLRSIENIGVDDYNFDGYEDFSVFESSHAGPNTSSIYFLFDPKTGKYFKSTFEGTSLEFDKKKKRIYESNQCCAGRYSSQAEYKVVNNKMVLIKKSCYEYNEKTEDLEKVKCE